MFSIFNKVPTWVFEVLVLVVFLLALFFTGKIQYWRGAHSVRVQDAAVAHEVKKQANLVSVKVVKEYVPVIKTVQLAGKIIIKKVPIYVTKNDDNASWVNNGFVSLWNATNQMQLPNSSSAANERRSAVVLSDIAAQHSREATICTETEKQRDALKDWIVKEQAAYAK